jgi:hypothetical protein
MSGQLYDGIRDDGPSDGANHVSDLPQIVDLSEGSPKGLGSEVLDHRQRSAPCFDIMRLEHVSSLLARSARSQ